MSTKITGEALVDLLAGQPEIGQGVAVRGYGRAGGALCVQAPHGVRGGAAERQPEVGIRRFDRADRVGDEVVIVDVVELRRVMLSTHGREAFEAANPQLQLVT